MGRLDLRDPVRDEDYWPTPHDGFEDGEQPVYRKCACGMTVRADRADLLGEHDAVCTAVHAAAA